jgi:hypothetical protein
MFEDMIFEKPRRWGHDWWGSSYLFDTKDTQPVVQMVRDVSMSWPTLCFRLDWSCEQEEFSTHFIRNGRLEGHRFDVADRREELFQALTGGTEDCSADVDWQIDHTVSAECSARFEKLWRAKVYRILYSQRRRKLAYCKRKAVNLPGRFGRGKTSSR